MKIIAINGSPRKDGNTSILIGKVFEELKAEGIETEEINVGAKQLKGCIACMKCWENKDGHCVIKDELNDYLDKLKSADGIILGSPVYCADVSGQMKIFMDRTSMVACANNDMFQRKIGASIVAVRRGGAVHAFHTMNAYFTISQMIIVGSSYWNFAFGMNKGDVLKDQEGMITMKNLGKNMAWLLKSLNASKNIVPQIKNNRD